MTSLSQIVSGNRDFVRLTCFGFLALIMGCNDVFGFQEGKPYPPDSGDGADTGSSDGFDSLGGDESKYIDGGPAREAGDAPPSGADASNDCRSPMCPMDASVDSGDGAES